MESGRATNRGSYAQRNLYGATSATASLQFSGRIGAGIYGAAQNRTDVRASNSSRIYGGSWGATLLYSSLWARRGLDPMILQ